MTCIIYTYVCNFSVVCVCSCNWSLYLWENIKLCFQVFNEYLQSLGTATEEFQWYTSSKKKKNARLPGQEYFVSAALPWREGGGEQLRKSREAGMWVIVSPVEHGENVI